MRAWGIETVSANAFDKDSAVAGVVNADGTIAYNANYSLAKIEVVPNERYSLHNVANTYYDRISCSCVLYDSNDKVVSTIEIRDTTTTNKAATGDVNIPTNARYMRVVVHNDYLDSCCVNLRHSGTFGNDTTYFRKVRELPEIANYFPDGMNSVGEVYDEINAENAVTRFGIVKLSDLSWGRTGTSEAGMDRWYSNSLKGLIKGTPTEDSIANVRCAKYDTISGNATYLANKGISVATSGAIHIYDPDYAAADVNTFVSALSDVYLCYELAEPIVTPITEPLQLDYDVADFGTERAISPEDSAPFRADIVYQFNAEGRIRDNGRNIDKLELQVNTLDVVTKSIATRFDGEMVRANGLVDGGGNHFWLPSTRTTDNANMLASAQFVIDSLPREVAQVLERKVGTIPQHLYPNILYEFSGSVTNLTIVSFNGQDDNYEDVWRVRCGLYEGVPINILPTILWENGIAPNPTEWGIYEFEFRKTPSADNNRILGKFKVYK
jgi:hypothetical protein